MSHHRHKTCVSRFQPHPSQAKEVVLKALQDHRAACAAYESGKPAKPPSGQSHPTPTHDQSHAPTYTAAERRSVSMASFASDLHTVRLRCERAQLQRAQVRDSLCVCLSFGSGIKS